MFQYLGVDTQDDQKIEIKARIDSASKMYHVMKNTFIGKKKVPRKVKISVYIEQCISRLGMKVGS